MLVATMARAQGPATNPAIAAQDTAYAPRYRFSPVYTNKITGDVSAVGMGNDFRTGFTTPWGSIFDFSVSSEDKNYRLQNRLERNKSMKFADQHVFNLFWNGSAAYSDSRVFNRSIASGGGVQDFIINDKLFTLGSTYRRAFGHLRTDATGSTGAISSERTFKNDQGLQAGMNGGVAYDLTDWMTWKGRGALRGSNDRSETTEARFNNLGSNEDSLATAIHLEAADSISFDASTMSYHGNRNYTDQARGSLGTQNLGVENVFREGEHRSTRNTSLAMRSLIFTRLTIGLNVSHDEQKFDYDVQTTRFSRTVGDLLTGNVSYKLPWRTVTTVRFENSSTLRDYGTQSIASLTDKRKRVAVTASHQFSKTLSVDFNGSTQLQQSFYLKYNENPRDRDQVDNNLNFRLTSTPFKKVGASVNVSYTSTEYINIDATQSSNNRTRELWDLRPGFSYAFNPMLTIVQTYGLSFEYTDYTFNPDQNFLDRNITFSNEFQFHPTKSIDVDFEYALHLHDNGSYLPDPVTGVRLLDVASQDRRDRTRIRVDYRATRHIAFFAENLYSQRQTWSPDTPNDRSYSPDGQITVGTQGNYDWGNGRHLRFQVSKVKRFSQFGADAEKDYWDAQSEFSYPF
ncbi:MAG TPA: hypothetical protein VFH88_06090 [Candidatus Krumholzibacteria bacterium]|nr:hypothetical protein [Candidatus Krumholzibacteria bacterium]